MNGKVLSDGGGGHANVLKNSRKANGVCTSLEGGGERGLAWSNGAAHTSVHKDSIKLTNGHSKKHDRGGRRILPEKEFKARDSLMTHMLRQDEYAGLYNIFVAFLINLTLFILITDLYDCGRINLGFSNLFAMFGKPWITWGLLGGMHFACAVPFYYVFRLWGDNRHSFRSSESIWDLSFAIGLGLFVYAFYYIPLQVHFAVQLPAASATMIVLEQLRLTMKLYAFIRSNIPRVLNSCWFCSSSSTASIASLCEEKSCSGGYNSLYSQLNGLDHLDKENNLLHLSSRNQPRLRQRAFGEERHSSTSFTASSIASSDLVVAAGGKIIEKTPCDDRLRSACPDYEKYLYFLYAPTLVYRDAYPRTKEIRWNFVLKNCVELLGCIYMYNLIHHVCGFVLVREFGMKDRIYSSKELLTFIFFQMITGSFGFLLGFFILLQTSQNIAAELLRFADREFYRDWWNSDSFGSYYRKWNTPVQDFLYTYIYKEAKEARLDRISRVLPSVLVFIISSLFHEYVLMYVLQVFYPLLLVLFGGFGMLLSFIPNRSSQQKGNLFVWWSLITGNGLIHAFYTLEHFARSNGCPPAQNPILDFFIPRSWTCGAVA